MLELPPIKLSPSDLTFLWDECKRCFYLKYNRNISRPYGAMPGIFLTIDRLMKGYFGGKATTEIATTLPPGVVQFGEKWVESQPISLPGRVRNCYIRGKFDTVIAFEDGSYGVVDFKTSHPRPAHIQFYGRQLGAYAYALEHAAPQMFAASPISRLGLLVVAPEAIDVTPLKQLAYLGSVTWLEIPHREDAFLEFIDHVLAILERPEPPDPAEKCPYCEYRSRSREHGL